VARALEGEGIELLEVSGGNYETPAMIGVQRASTAAREAYFLEYAEQLREEVSLPLMVTGGFRTRSAMNDALASGATDVIGIARPFAVVPELAGELVTGSAVEAPDFRPGIGIRLVDDVLQLVWFQRQMERWSLGLDADPVLGSWGVLARHLAYMASTVLGAATVNRPGPLVAEAVGRA
jgi:tRNA-dihydrouridine synthase